MKHALFVLALWLMSAPDSYSQTSKMDDYLVKDAALASARRSSASIPSRSQGYMINADPASVSKPTVPQKLQSIIGHTQNLKNTTQVLKANTDAIEANTKALAANTEALQANIKASQTNKHVRSEQRQQATPVPPAPKVPVYTPAVLASKPAKPAAPATVVVAAMPKAPAKPQPQPAPAPVSKEMLKPAAPVVAIAKVPMKPIELPVEKPRVISTMPVAAAPVKAERTFSMAEGRTISTMSMANNNIKVVPTVAAKDLPNPAAAKSTKPVEVRNNAMTAMSMVAAAVPAKPATPVAMSMPKPVVVPAAAPAAAPAKAPRNLSPKVQGIAKVEDVVRNSKSTNIADLMHLPLMEKMYDYKISNPKYYPVAAKAGLKHNDVITTHGYLQVVATDDSGKAGESYSLQLTLNSVKGDSCFIVKIPADQLAKLGGKDATDNSKKFVRELVKGRVPCTGGNILRKPVYVTVTGQLSYNSSHATFMRNAKVAYQGRRDMNSYTPWEIVASNVAFATPQ